MYNKTVWHEGDVVHADQLNNIEDGIKTLEGAVEINKLKLDTVELNALPNIIEGVQFNGVAVTPENKIVAINAATVEQGVKADNAIPMPSGNNGQILEKDSTVQGGVKWVNKPEDGTTPHIDETSKHWMIGEEDTEVDAEGKDAYQVYVASVPSGTTPMTKTEWLASLKGEKGDNAINPFKGWLTSTNDLPDNPHVGDYAYIEDNGTTYVYRCSTEGEWPTTSEEEKEPSNASFATAQLLNNVKIDNTGLEDVNDEDSDSSPTIPKAVDVSRLKKDFEDTKIDIYGGEVDNVEDTISTTTEVSSGLKHGSFATDKTWNINNAVDGYLIPLSSYKNSSNKVTIYAKDTGVTRVTFLTEEITWGASGVKSDSYFSSNMIVDGAKVGRIQIDAGSKKEFILGDDDNYLFVSSKNSSGVAEGIFPKEIVFSSTVHQDSIIPNVENSLDSNSQSDALSAAKGKELKGHIDTIEKDLYPTTHYKEGSEITGGTLSIFIINSNGEWVGSGHSGSSERFRVNPGDVIVVKSESGNGYGIGAVLVEDTVFTEGQPVTFSSVEGFTSRFNIKSKGEVITNEPVYITMPSDAYWFYHTKKSSGTSLDNVVYEGVPYQEDGVVLELEKLQADVYGETIYFDKESLAFGEESNGGFSSTGWTASGSAGGRKHKTLDCSDREYGYLHVTPDTKEKNYVAFLLKDIGYDLSEDRSVEYLLENGYIETSASLILVTEEKDIKIPNGTQYVVLSRNVPKTGTTTKYQYPKEIFGTDIYEGQGVATTDNDTYYDKGEVVSLIANSEGNHLIVLNKEVDSSGYEIPSTLQHLNCVKKIHQYADVKWTPLLDIARGSGTYFEASTEYTGVPYSSVKELDKFIGKDVSLETFMTAVKNPYSLLYTECVSAARSKSDWGFTYHGSNSDEYYGQVCSEFTSMLTGFKTDYATAMHAWMDKYGHKIVKLYLQTPDALEIGDILWKEGHTMIIEGLKRDQNGKITHIRVAESAWHTTRVNSPETYESFMTNRILDTDPENHCIIYRSLNLYKNVNYEPSPFVKVSDDEPEPIYTYNYDISTFAGHKPAFIASHVGQNDGDLVVLNYNLDGNHGGWTAIQLYKNDSLVDTYQLSSIVQSELPEGQRNHALKLGNGLTYGMYKARMTDGNEYSDYVEFEVIDTNVDYSFDGDFIDIDFSSANATPVAFKIALQSGSVVVQRELTDDEIKNGHVHTNVVRFYNERYDASGTQADIKNISNICVKVYFQGKFGRVTNQTEMIANPWK